MARRLADRPATPSERSRASRLRRKASLSERDRAWLSRYKIAREAFAEKRERARGPRLMSARAEAERAVREFLRGVGIQERRDGVAIVSEWYTPRKAGHAHAEWNGNETPIAFDDIPEFDFTGDNPKDRTLNIRVKLLNVTVVRGVDKRKRPIMTSDASGEWISLVAMTDAWHNLNADVARAIEHLPERPSLRFLDDSQVEIAGVSVLVSDKREDDQ